MFYSKSTGGFYRHEIHGDNIPADAVEITAAEYSAAFDGQASGFEIVPGDDGKPKLQARVQTPEELVAAAKEKARIRIAELRDKIADHLADIAVGTPAEQGMAKAALGLLRAELALNKAKL